MTSSPPIQSSPFFPLSPFAVQQPNSPYEFRSSAITELLEKSFPITRDLDFPPQLVGNQEKENLDPTPNKRSVETLDLSTPKVECEAEQNPKAKYQRTAEKVGKGAYGLVTKASHLLTGSPVAIKTHEPDSASYEGALQESLILSEHKKLKTPHSLYIRDSYESTPKKDEDDKLCPIHTIVTDLIPAPDIHKNHLSTNALLGPLKWDEIKTIGRQVLEFISHSQQHQIAHLDLKPANLIYLQSIRQTIVLDCGLSEIDQVTEKGWLCQTSPYRCPEEILSFGNKDSPSRNGSMDVWSVGCILFELLIHKNLFNILDSSANLPISFKHHLQMIAQQIGMPSTEFLSSWKHASDFYSISPLPPHQVRIKKPKKLPNVIPWQTAVLEAAKGKGIPASEIELFIDLLNQMINYSRPSAAELLKHPYFKDDISFHLKGMFYPTDKIFIYRGCDAPDGKPIAGPALLIDTPAKLRHDCLHIPRDPNNKYFIMVVRNGKNLLEEHYTLEDNAQLSLEIPEEIAEAPSPSRFLNKSELKRVLFQ